MRNEELEAYWRGHVAGWRVSGETQRAYCERHGLKKHSLSYWHGRLGRHEATSNVGSALTLIPGRVIPEATGAARVSLHSPSGWRLELAALPPAAWLAELWGGRP